VTETLGRNARIVIVAVLTHKPAGTVEVMEEMVCWRLVDCTFSKDICVESIVSILSLRNHLLSVRSSLNLTL
jgi:hypothetical protein